jgi:hypothetical protein
MACAALVAPQARGAVYWGSDRDGIGAANLDGSAPQWNYFYSWESPGPACGVAVNAEFLYWSAPGGIVRRRLDGEGFYPWAVVPTLYAPCGVALDQSHIYWVKPEVYTPLGPTVGSLGRANLDGTGVDDSFVTDVKEPCDLALSGGYVYWMEEDGIGRARLDGSNPERSFIPFSNWASDCGLAASDTYLYWVEGETIARANLDGGGIHHAFIPDAGPVNGIALDSGHIYWAGGVLNSTGSIGRANLDGTQADPVWISSSGDLPRGVAVDARPTPPYLILPSRPLRFRENVFYNLRSGAALVGVYVPPQGQLSRLSPQGQLTVTSPGLSWRVFGSTARLASEGNYSLWWIRIRSGKGAVGRRIRSQLRRRGWARVKLRVAYTQERVYPETMTHRVVLRRYAHARAGWVQHPGPLHRRIGSPVRWHVLRVLGKRKVSIGRYIGWCPGPDLDHLSPLPKIQRVRQVERPRRVILTAFLIHRAPKNCAGVEAPVSYVVTLRHKLGSRSIYDGSVHPPARRWPRHRHKGVRHHRH